MTPPPAIAQRPIRVLCVDDHPDIREILRLVVDNEPDMECAGCLSSADHLVEKARELNADVVLLDATMPGADPLASLRELAEAVPDARTIIYTGHDDSEFIERVIDAGAWGYLSKSDPPERLTDCIRQVASGGRCFPPYANQQPARMV